MPLTEAGDQLCFDKAESEGFFLIDLSGLSSAKPAEVKCVRPPAPLPFTFCIHKTIPEDTLEHCPIIVKSAEEKLMVNFWEFFVHTTFSLFSDACPQRITLETGIDPHSRHPTPEYSSFQFLGGISLPVLAVEAGQRTWSS